LIAIDRRRFRTPTGYVVMGYKTALGVAELAAGVALTIPPLDPITRLRRWSLAERRYDPNDLLAGFVTRHVPAVLPHRWLVVAILLILGAAKVTAATAMFYGREWGLLLLIAVVVAALPFDIYEAAVRPSIWHGLFAAANLLAAAVLVTIETRRRSRPLTPAL
jgi:uncharacterized membrane protein